jgi:hypothetical protein
VEQIRNYLDVLRHHYANGVTMRQLEAARSRPRFFALTVLAALSALALSLSALALGQGSTHTTASGSVRAATKAVTLAATATAGQPAGGVLGDVTGDGLADILAIDPAGNLWLYPNTGSSGAGMFSDGRSQVGQGWTGYTLAAVAPLYGATRAGILAIDPAGNLWYYPNTGGSGLGTFGAPSKVGQGWTGYTIFGVADLYGTGAPGIVASTPAFPYVAGTLLYFANTGGTGLDTFGSVTNIGQGWTGYTAEVADISGSLPDILAVDSSGNLWLYPNTGVTGTPFASRTEVGSGWSGYQALDAGQLTSTGSASILAIDSRGGLWFYSNTGGSGTSTFGAPVQVGTGWSGYRIN